MPLYWRVCLINGAVFAVATLALALGPATVSRPVLISEAIVLVVGLTAIVVVNSLMLRTSLAPLDRLVRLMETVDLQRPGQRLPEAGSGAVGNLVRGFNAMLVRLETERRTSNAKALTAQEAERHRIAQELHDQIGQRLTAVLLSLKQIADRAPGDLVDEIRVAQDATRASLEEVRDVARRLRPGVLEDLGLHDALAALATDFATHGVQIRRIVTPGLPDLESDVELVIYRVAQEALTNVARHARADDVELSLTRHGEAIMLRVADNGRGLLGAEEGTGIRGMRERALFVHGELRIAPRAGGGSEVALKVPLKERP
ncbi:HAMP domain-containing sensor histidine kinase [Kribbella swartbergensis]